MDYAVVCAVALLVSGLTLFSGFGLGTLLLPAFAVFFPVPLAVAATAVVHLANNAFKVALVGRDADPGVVLRFGLPATVAAFAGAALLNLFAALPPLATYELAGGAHEVTPAKLTIAVLMVVFALFELVPQLARLGVDRRWLALGGLLSGFFGGLSGHQGALRSAFLIKTGLGKQAFVGTGAVCATGVDVARLAVYGAGLYRGHFIALGGRVGGLVAAASVAAFLGSFLGARLLAAVTLRFVQLVVGAMLVLVAVLLGTGLV